MSYLEYEITMAFLEHKKIIVVFNSARKEENWLPSWYTHLLSENPKMELCRKAFWKDSSHDQDCYQDIKCYLQ